MGSLLHAFKWEGATQRKNCKCRKRQENFTPFLPPSTLTYCTVMHAPLSFILRTTEQYFPVVLFIIAVFTTVSEILTGDKLKVLSSTFLLSCLHFNIWWERSCFFFVSQILSFKVLKVLAVYHKIIFHLQRWRWSVWSVWYSRLYCTCVGIMPLTGLLRWQFSGRSTWESRLTSCWLEAHKRWENLTLPFYMYIYIYTLGPSMHSRCQCRLGANTQTKLIQLVY